jgi:hypothetical protein
MRKLMALKLRKGLEENTCETFATFIYWLTRSSRLVALIAFSVQDLVQFPNFNSSHLRLDL